MTQCNQCDGELKTTLVKVDRTVGDYHFSASVRGEVCTSCGEEYIDGLMLQSFELAIAQALGAAAEQSGAAIKFMRKAVGLRAADLAAWLDVVPETVSRWETNRNPIDRSAYAVLVMLVKDRANGTDSTEQTLRALTEPAPIAHDVELNVA